MPASGPESAGEAEEHLSGCADCAAEFRRHGALAERLRSLGAELRAVQAPPRLEARLAAAFRARCGVEIRRAGPRWLPVAAWASAAAAVLALALFLVRDRLPRPPQRDAPVAVLAQDAGDWGETDSGFVPLPNAQPMNLDEETDVVRVELPRSAMLAMGYAVPAEQASELVQADVLMGTDGLARAVRFQE